jgi:hypothetical protein
LRLAIDVRFPDYPHARFTDGISDCLWREQ